MINSIGSLEIRENSGLSKVNSGQKMIESFSRKSGISFIDHLNSNKNNKEVDARNIHLKEAARDFEKIFVTYMIKDMWKTIPSDENSEMPGANIYLEMIQSALANEMVKGKGLGIANMLYNQLKNKTKQDGNG